MTQEISGPDGRRLSVESLGDPEGRPVFLLHGALGGRNGPRPRGIALYRLGIRLICYDRPGYQGSDRHPGRTVASAADDVRIIADYLGIDRLSVVGRSEGAPHALACAALLPDRVISAAALGSLAPRDAEGLDWEAGMMESSVRAYRYAGMDTAYDLRAFLEEEAKRAGQVFGGFPRELGPESGDHDEEALDGTGLRRIVASIYHEALRNDCVEGRMDDIIALGRPWGFEPAKIAVPVKLWGGRDDVSSPIGHIYWLAKWISGAEVEIQHGQAHFSTVLLKSLTWVARKMNEERPLELMML